jgi:hypothetical protein
MEAARIASNSCNAQAFWVTAKVNSRQPCWLIHSQIMHAAGHHLPPCIPRQITHWGCRWGRARSQPTCAAPESSILLSCRPHSRSPPSPQALF